MTAERLAAVLSVGQTVGQFSAALLPSIETFEGFKKTVSAQSGPDIRFTHAPTGSSQVDAAKLSYGVNWFGARVSPAAEIFRDGNLPQRETETVLLHDAIFSPSSTVVCSTTRGLYDATLQNFLATPEGLAALVRNDGLYELDASGTLRFTSLIMSVPTVDMTVIPICGTGFHNYGHFLYDGLPAIILLLDALRDPNVKIVGPPLAPWQSAILNALGLLHLYLPLNFPTLFHRVVVSSLISLHVSYPSRVIRPLFDAIRFKLGGAHGIRSRRVWISRQDDTTRRILMNRAEVEACAERYGLEVVMPQKLSFEQQVHLFSACSVVGGESGAGMANVGFCDPGTRVLELQPVKFVEGWTRAACMIFGLEWNVLFAEADERLVGRRDAQQPLVFKADLKEMSSALERLTRP